MPRQAPAAKSIESGSTTACADGSAIHCAAVPWARPQAPFHTHTRWPMRAASTPAPTASMVPAPSLCGMISAKGRVLLRVPARVLTSEGLTPEQARRTRTSPGPGSGRGRSPMASTSRAGPTRS